MDSKRAYLKSVRSLYIWDASWGYGLPNMSQLEDGSMLPHDSFHHCCGLRSLLLFTDLKEIRIFLKEAIYSWEHVRRATYMEECRVLFTTYLERHANFFEGGKIPRVIVQGVESVKGSF
jgi:hypothetical protein